MPRTFLTLTQDEIDLKLAEALKSREVELLNYDFEQAGHEAVLLAIPDADLKSEVDAAAVKYRALTRDQLIKAAKSDGVSSDVLKRASDLAARDKAAHEIEAIKIELAKSEQHYANLLDKLPEERRAAALTALAAKEAEARNG